MDFRIGGSIINIPHYPREYVSFKDCANISDDKIKSWIDECIYILERDKLSEYAYSSSGDTIVTVFRANKELNGFRYKVVVSKGYLTTFVE